MATYYIETRETYYKQYQVEAKTEQEAKDTFNSDMSRVYEVEDYWGDDVEVVRVWRI